MPAPNPGSFRNLVLRALPPDELARLSRDFIAVNLPRRTSLELPGKKIGHIHFVESGIVSIVAAPAPTTQVEIGIIGYEGMTGMAVTLGTDRMPFSSYVQVDATAHRIETEAVQAAMLRSAECRRVFHNFAQTFLVQMAETAVANARATLAERLARWLLMAQDRIGADDIALTHEFLALMMGARRPGVTEAIHALTREKLITGARGRITIRSRAGLEKRAGAYYGMPERELARLLGGGTPRA